MDESVYELPLTPSTIETQIGSERAKPLRIDSKSVDAADLSSARLDGRRRCRGCDAPACDGWSEAWMGLVWSQQLDFSHCLSCYEAAHSPTATDEMTSIEVAEGQSAGPKV